MAAPPLLDPWMLAPVAVCVLCGPDLVIEQANRRYELLAGHRALVGKPLLIAQPELRGTGLDHLLRDVMRTREQVSTGETLHEIRREPGGPLEETYWTFTYAPLGDDGVVVFSQEVTEQVLARQAAQVARREAHDLSERLRIALEASGLGMWERVVDGDTYWSPRCRAILGVDDEVAADPALGRSQIDPRDWPILDRAMA